MSGRVGRGMGSYAVEVFQKYMGTGLTVIWFVIALIYLFLCEERKPRRILFVYTPVFILLLFFNPLFVKMFCFLAESEIYFRTCWLLPIIIVIAYAVVHITGRMKEKKAALFAVISVLLILVSGKLVYSNPLYSRAQNIYHVPDSVVHICDAVRVPGREVMAAFPEEMLLYVRQYSPYVCMPYGREVLMGGYNELNAAMEKEVIDMEQLAPLAREAGCHYVILKADKEIMGSPADYGWIRFGEMDGYIIYRDPAMELVIPQP